MQRNSRFWLKLWALSGEQEFIGRHRDFSDEKASLPLNFIHDPAFSDPRKVRPYVARIVIALSSSDAARWLQSSAPSGVDLKPGPGRGGLLGSNFDKRGVDLGANLRCNFMQLDRHRMTSDEDKIALLIDGPNLFAAARALGFDIDYKRLLAEFQSCGGLVRAFYYAAIIEDQEFSIRPLIDWLDYNGFTVIMKQAKEFDDGAGRRKFRRNMSVELAVNAMELAEHVDQIVLFSGDGDFRSLVEVVQRRGVRVTVVSTVASQPPMIADELRRQAGVFTDLVDLQSRISRDLSDRPTLQRTTPPSGV